MNTKFFSIFSILSLLFILSCFDDSGAGDDAPSAMPLPPKSIQAEQYSGKAIIYFGSSTGATSYTLYWANNPGVTKTNSLKVNNITTPYTQNSLTDGRYYYYRISAVNTNGESELSEEVNAIPSPQNVAITDAPTDFTAEGVILNGNSCIRLRWKAVYAATSYTVYWSTTSGVTSGSPDKNEGELSPSINGPFVKGTRYYFIVTAKNTGYESPASAEISFVAP